MSDAPRDGTHPRRSLTPAERLACIGAAVALGSMLLPWYGIPLTGGLSVSGFNAFGFAAAALLVAVGGAVVVVMREAAGRPPVRPLRSADLVMLARSLGGACRGLPDVRSPRRARRIDPDLAPHRTVCRAWRLHRDRRRRDADARKQRRLTPEMETGRPPGAPFRCPHGRCVGWSPTKREVVGV